MLEKTLYTIQDSQLRIKHTISNFRKVCIKWVKNQCPLAVEVQYLYGFNDPFELRGGVSLFVPRHDKLERRPF
jgi:hypothetical protein